MKDRLIRIARNERAATAVEYGLIVSLIVLAIVGALNTFADVTINMWNDVSTEVSNA